MPAAGRPEKGFLMSEHITVRGFVATDPETRTTQSGLVAGSFRLAATDRRFDRSANSWVDGPTNWFTVNIFRNLANNARASLQKGQPVVVTGRLRIRPWETEERSGTAVEVDADAIGHDLSLGTAAFNRLAGRSVPAGGAENGAPQDPGAELNTQTGELKDGESRGTDINDGEDRAGIDGDEDDETVGEQHQDAAATLAGARS